MTVLNPSPPPIAQLLVAGHSRVAEGAASQEDYGVSHKTARRLGASLAMPAQGGSCLCMQEGATIGGAARYGGIGRLLQFVTSTRTAGPYLPSWQSAILDWGLNDMSYIGPTLFAAVFAPALRGALARIRAGRIIEDTDASLTYTGASWANVAQTSCNSGTQVKSVATNGDSVTVPVPADFPGGAISLRFLTAANGNGALWTVTGTGSCAGVNTTWDTRNINGFDFGGTRAANGKMLNTVLRLTGLPSGAGTLVVTATTIQGLGYFDCAELESPYPGPVAAGLDCRPVNYSLYSSAAYSAINDTDAATVWNTVNSVCAEFTDGYAFGLACDDIFQKNPVYFASDGAHWNDLGHSLAADRFASALQAHSNPLRITQSGGFFKPYFYPLDGTGQAGAYATGWTDFSASWEKGGYRKDNLTGRVQLNGTAQKTGGAATDPIFTLPVGYRPAGTLSLPTTVWTGGAYQTAQLQITSAGVVNVASGGSIAAGNATVLNASFQPDQ